LRTTSGSRTIAQTTARPRKTRVVTFIEGGVPSGQMSVE
jgi:hypothetical protein